MTGLPDALIEKIRAALNDPTMYFVEEPEHMAEWVDRATRRVAAALLVEFDIRVEYGASHDDCQHWGYRNPPDWATDRGWSPVRRVVMAYTGPTEPGLPPDPVAES